MNQAEKKENIKYNKSNIYYDWSDIILWTSKDKEKIKSETGILSTFGNENFFILRLHLKYTVSAGL